MLKLLKFFIILSVLFFVIPSCTFFNKEKILEGQIDKVEGQLSAFERSNQFNIVSLEQKIQKEDIYYTGRDTLLDLVFSLHEAKVSKKEEKNRLARITLFENSALKVEDFFTKEDVSPLHLKFSEGLMHALSPKLPPFQTVKVETPESTIGVRGTEWIHERTDVYRSQLIKKFSFRDELKCKPIFKILEKTQNLTDPKIVEVGSVIEGRIEVVLKNTESFEVNENEAFLIHNEKYCVISLTHQEKDLHTWLLKPVSFSEDHLDPIIIALGKASSIPGRGPSTRSATSQGDNGVGTGQDSLPGDSSSQQSPFDIFDIFRRPQQDDTDSSGTTTPPDMGTSTSGGTSGTGTTTAPTSPVAPPVVVAPAPPSQTPAASSPPAITPQDRSIASSALLSELTSSAEQLSDQMGMYESLLNSSKQFDSATLEHMRNEVQNQWKKIRNRYEEATAEEKLGARSLIEKLSRRVSYIETLIAQKEQNIIEEKKAALEKQRILEQELLEYERAKQEQLRKQEALYEYQKQEELKRQELLMREKLEKEKAYQEELRKQEEIRKQQEILKQKALEKEQKQKELELQKNQSDIKK